MHIISLTDREFQKFAPVKTASAAGLGLAYIRMQITVPDNTVYSNNLSNF